MRLVYNANGVETLNINNRYTMRMSSTIDRTSTLVCWSNERVLFSYKLLLTAQIIRTSRLRHTFKRSRIMLYLVCPDEKCISSYWGYKTRKIQISDDLSGSSERRCIEYLHASPRDLFCFRYTSSTQHQLAAEARKDKHRDRFTVNYGFATKLCLFRNIWYLIHPSHQP